MLASLDLSHSHRSSPLTITPPKRLSESTPLPSLTPKTHLDSQNFKRAPYSKHTENSSSRRAPRLNFSVFRGSNTRFSQSHGHLSLFLSLLSRLASPTSKPALSLSLTLSLLPVIALSLSLRSGRSPPTTNKEKGYLEEGKPWPNTQKAVQMLFALTLASLFDSVLKKEVPKTFGSS
ncbi:hypothetical protein Tco_0381503 [Tanacetum coccineum]